jgi:hypothetical protein
MERSVAWYLEVMREVNADRDMNLSDDDLRVLAGMLFDAYAVGVLTGKKAP